MRQSQLFTKTQKTAPKDESSKNAQLLIRAGFIHKEMAGVYSFLPLGWRVMGKIMNIIREEMNAIGGQEIFLSALQDPKIWEKSGRWADNVIDVWFKTMLKSESQIGLGSTHEEPITQLMRDHMRSWRDLPVYAYQFQTKFRNELRAKSGILRTREFIMKDLYSFSRNEQEHNEFYEKAKHAYLNIFSRVGIGEKTYLTFASGGSFSAYSHEFQTVCEAGEDIIYIDEEKRTAINEEIVEKEAGKYDKAALKKAKAIEVGNIFTLGTKFSEALQLLYQDEKGQKHPVFMGSYGIGPGRAMGTVVEALSDEKGIVWPISIAPFSVHLIALSGVEAEAEMVYKELSEQGLEALYDDRTNAQAGEKFADADLIGIPYRLVASTKTLAQELIEVKERKTGQVELLKIRELPAYLRTKISGSV